MRRPRRLGVIVLAPLLVPWLMATPAWADGPAGSDPPQNFALGPMPAACESQPDGAACQNAAIYYLDQARASLGQPAYPLPADFTSLSAADQDLILTDLDRTLYGLPAIPGRTAALDADALSGANGDADPMSTDPDFQDFTSNWAGGFPNLEAAYEAWMYDDGPGSSNIDCTPTDTTGCWGHRHDILWSFGGSGALAMGAATGVDPSGAPGYAMLLGMGDRRYTPSYTYTWAAAQADGAGVNVYNPSAPQLTIAIEMEGTAGTVSDSHGQVCKTGTCDFSEPAGQPVTLTAAAPSGSAFSQWLGACSGTGPCTLTPQQTTTFVGAYFVAASGGGSGGGSGPGAGGSGSGGPGGSGATGSAGTGSGPQTGAAKVVTPVRIVRVTTSRATVHLVLHGSRLVCTLLRRRDHRWVRVHTGRCGASVTYRRLKAGRYRVTVTSGATSVSRTFTLRTGV